MAEYGPEGVVSEERRTRLFVDGFPRYVRCYDAPWQDLRYTVLFTHCRGSRPWLAMTADPHGPDGAWVAGDGRVALDQLPESAKKRFLRLGRRLSIQDLPDACRCRVHVNYLELWRQ